MDNLEAKVKGITYSDKSTNFYILKVISQNRKNVTVKGTFPGVNINIGLKIKFEGSWYEHEKYGTQFNAVRCDVLQEKGRNGIVSYLISHVPSIGPVTASKLYLEFGDDLVDILNSNPEKILEVDFLNRKQAESILDEWKESSMMRTVAIILTDLGLNATQVKTVYKRWGVGTRDILQEDPYRLAECEGLGFVTADNAARKLGIGANDIKRVKALILFIMDELCSSNGHMFLVSEEIQEFSRKIFRRYNLDPFSHGPYLSDINFYQALRLLEKDQKIVSMDDNLYLSRHWHNEFDSAKYVSEMVKQEPGNFGDIESQLVEFEKEKDVQLSPEQREAFLLLNKSNIIVISGFPGTGKTLLTSAFVYLFEKNNVDYALMSPTGIAAKRASQVTGKSASTIHRALGYDREGNWEFNRSNKFHIDAVIVDEMSMVDTKTFYHLISALGSNTTLILVGDHAQLPSVGSGHVLKNLMSSFVPHVALTQIYRQNEQSDIVHVAHQILNSEPVDTSFNKNSEFVFLHFAREQIVEELCKMTQVMKDKQYEFQVMAPMYDGTLGVNNLNNELRDVLNSDYIDGRASKIKHSSTDIYEGDRVMIIKNDYDRMIFNGDVGKIQRISIKDDEVEVRVFNWFDHESLIPRYVDKVFVYTVEEAKRLLRVAYACTTHKCQGNEIDYVLMPMTMQYGIMLYRNLIYTAITRAKKKVFIFGDPMAFRLAVENNRQIIRNSNLSSLIDNFVNGELTFLNRMKSLNKAS